MRPILTRALVVLAVLIGGAAVGPPVTTAAVAEERAPTAADAVAKPVLVVMDVSGSMDDANAVGEAKLLAAKKAVDEVLRAGGATTDVGVWTFPNAEQCSPGSGIITPGSTTNVADATAKVDALQTQGGGTPIGAALQSAADSLAAQGYAGATIVLVTDGLNNCDPDPCEVAKTIERRGFDLTVHGIGFAAESGTDVALSCIAAATGGTVTSADDQAGLDRIFTDLTRPAIKIAVTSPKTVQAGQTFTIGVTVSNPSKNPADDISLALTFLRDASHTARPLPLAPSLSIGNLAAGQSTRRQWVASSQTGWSGASARWRVVASAPRVLTVVQQGDILFGPDSVLPSGELLGPAVQNGWPIVIMGDSYSSGEGSGDYLDGTSSAAQECHRSRNTYLADVLQPQQVDIIACSGAVIADMSGTQRTTTGAFRAVPQLEQLQRLSKAPGAVVLTLGGNDAGFADIAEACVTGSGAAGCGGDAAVAQAEYDGIASRTDALAALYKLIWDRVNSPTFVAQRHNTYAPVIVSTYPEAFLAGFRGICSASFNVAEATYANAVADALSRSSSAAVAIARRDGYEVYSTSGPLKALQPDHTYCAADGISWLRRALNALVGSEALHPTKAGYRGITANLVQWEAAQARTDPTPAAKAKARDPDSDASAFLRLSVLARPTTANVLPYDSGVFEPGQTVTFQVDGFAPSSPVVLEQHSTLLGLGTTLADAHGRAILRAYMPNDVELGQHRIIAIGVGPDGRSRTVSMPVTIRPSTPLWVLAIALVGLLALLVLLLFVLRSRTRRRRRARRAGSDESPVTP